MSHNDGASAEAKIRYLSEQLEAMSNLVGDFTTLQDADAAEIRSLKDKLSQYETWINRQIHNSQIKVLLRECRDVYSDLQKAASPVELMAIVTSFENFQFKLADEVAQHEFYKSKFTDMLCNNLSSDPLSAELGRLQAVVRDQRAEIARLTGSIGKDPTKDSESRINQLLESLNQETNARLKLEEENNRNVVLLADLLKELDELEAENATLRATTNSDYETGASTSDENSSISPLDGLGLTTDRNTTTSAVTNALMAARDARLASENIQREVEAYSSKRSVEVVREAATPQLSEHNRAYESRIAEVVAQKDQETLARVALISQLTADLEKAKNELLVSHSRIKELTASNASTLQELSQLRGCDRSTQGPDAIERRTNDAKYSEHDVLVIADRHAEIVAGWEREKQSLLADIHRLTSECETARSDTKTSHERIRQLEEQLKSSLSLSQELTDLQLANNELLSLAESMQADLAAKDAELSSLVASNEINAAAATAASERSDNTSLMNEALAAVSAEKGQVILNLQQTRSALEEERDRLAATISAKSREVDLLRNTVKELQQRIEQCIADPRNELDVSALDGLVREINELKDANDQLFAMCESKSKDNADAMLAKDQEIARLNEAMSQRDIHLEALIHELSESQDHVVELQRSLANRETSRSTASTGEVNGQVQELMTQLTDLSAINEELMALSEDMRVELADKDQQIAELSSQLKSQRAQISQSFNDEIADLRQQLSRKEMSSKELDSEINDLRAANEELLILCEALRHETTDALATKSTELKLLEARLAEQAASSNGLTPLLAETDAKTQELTQRLVTQEAAFAVDRAQLEATIQQLHVMCDKQNDELSALREQAHRMSKELKKVPQPASRDSSATEMEDLRTANEELRSLCETFREQLINVKEAELFTQQAFVISQDDELAELRSANEELMSLCESMREEIAAKNTQIAELRLELHTTAMSEADFRSQLCDALALRGSLGTEVSQSRLSSQEQVQIQVQKVSDVEVERLKSELANASSSLLLYRRRIDELETSQTQVKELVDLGSANDELLALCESLRADLLAKDAELAALKTAVAVAATTKSDVVEVEMKLAGTVAQCESLAATVSAREQSLSELQKVHKAQIAQLQSDLETAQQSLRAAQSTSLGLVNKTPDDSETRLLANLSPTHPQLQELVELRSANDELLLLCESMKSDLSDLEIRSAAEAEALKTTCKEALDIADALRLDVQRLEVAEAEAKRELHAQQTTAESAVSLCEQMQLEMTQCQSQVADQASLISQLREALDEKAITITTLEQQVGSLQELNQTNATLSELVNELRMELAEQEGANESLLQQLHSLFDGTRHSLTALEVTNEDLSRQLAAKRSNESDAVQEMASLLDEKASLETLVKLNDQLLGAINGTFLASVVEATDGDGSSDDLQEMLDQARQQVDVTYEVLLAGDLSAGSSILRARLLEESAQRTVAVMVLHRVFLRCQSLRASLDQLEEQSEEQRNHLQRSVASITEKLTTAVGLKDFYLDELDQLRKQVEVREREEAVKVADLTRDLADASQQCKTLASAVEMERSNADSARMDLSLAHARMESLGKELLESRAACERAIADRALLEIQASNEAEERRAEINSLQRKLTRLNEIMAQQQHQQGLRMDNSDKHPENPETEQLVKTLKESNRNLQSQYEQLERKWEQLQRHEETKTICIRSLEKQVVTSNEVIDRLTLLSSTTICTRCEHPFDLEEVRDALRARIQLRDKVSLINQLHDEVASMRTRLGNSKLHGDGSSVEAVNSHICCISL